MKKGRRLYRGEFVFTLDRCIEYFFVHTFLRPKKIFSSLFVTTPFLSPIQVRDLRCTGTPKFIIRLCTYIYLQFFFFFIFLGLGKTYILPSSVKLLNVFSA